MKKNIYYLTIAAVGVITTTALVAGITMAFSGEGGKFGWRQDPVKHEAIQEALETGDYQSWLEAAGDCPMSEKITEENFSQFVELHQLKQEGKFEEAKALAEELELSMGFGKGIKGRGMCGNCQEQIQNMLKQGKFIDTNNDGVCDNILPQEE